MLARKSCTNVTARSGRVEVDDALGLTEHKNPIVGRGTAACAGDRLIRVLVVHRLDEPALNGGERTVVEVAVHPRAQVGVLPRDLLEGHVVVLARLENVCAQEQELAVDFIEDNPLNRLRTVLCVSVLLVGAEGHGVALGRRAVRQRGIGFDEGLRALRRVAVTAERMEEFVRPLGVPGLVQGDGLAIAHRVAHDDRENGDEG